MNYFLYQLRFETAVHFGAADSALSVYHSEDHFRADTLFSALCHRALQIEGEMGLNRLVRQASDGNLLLSDSMPWGGRWFYLPKPVYAAYSAPDIPSEKRKALKKQVWIPAEQLDAYCASLQNGTFFDIESVNFGSGTEVTKAVVPENGNATPYSVGLYRYYDGCGLYFLLACRDIGDHDWLSMLIHALGVSGIGGKISAGYGKFTVANEIYLNGCLDHQTQSLYDALNRHEAAAMLLTTALPTNEELDAAMEDAYYRVIRRSGFVASNSYAKTERKKQTQFYFEAGSVFRNRFSGAVFEIGGLGTHPVYRYAKPIFMGVKL